MIRMELLISRQTKLYPNLKPRKKLESAIKTLLLHEERPPDVEISILLCDDNFIHDLNLQHRGYDKPTDVLSFPQEDEMVLGDVVISLDTAAKQAESAGWPLTNEVILLTIHGVLHLIGYNDDTEEESKVMRDKTSRILADLAVKLPSNITHPYLIEYM